MTDSPGLPPAGQAPAKVTCSATTTAGQPCRATPLPGRPLCLWHDPEADDMRQAARSKGAASANRLRSIRGHQPKLDSVPRLVAYNSRLIYTVIAGELDPNVARTIVYALLLQKGLIEVGDIEKRLAAVESRLAATQEPKGRAMPWVG